MMTEINIGQQFDSQSTPEEIVEQISDNEFDVKFLTSYEHITELGECCVLAVERMAAEPFTGRKSCADVMGRAMELLCHHHRLNAPRGWVPVIRLLRSSPGLPPGRYVGEQHYSPAPEESSMDSSVFVPPAEAVLTHSFSALCAIDLECGGILRAYGEQHPEIAQVLVNLAKSHGVPQGWGRALIFVDLAITEFGERVPDALLTLRNRLLIRCQPPGEG
jgi:hypothetical protein